MSSEPSTFVPVSELQALAPRAEFPWTICVLFYGDHPELSGRFLDSLYRFTDPAAFQLRAGLNEVCDETKRAVAAMAETYDNVSVVESPENIYKCPMMRRLFHESPLESEWTLWFDDDSHVRGPGWVLDLALTMQNQPDAELFGSLRKVTVSEGLEKFISSARWYRKLPRDRDVSDDSPIIIFPVGGFWAIRTQRILEADWPDVRLQHFQTDYTLGEAMRQLGVRLAHFESGIRIDDAARRGPRDTPFKLRHDYDSL